MKELMRTINSLPEHYRGVAIENLIKENPRKSAKNAVLKYVKPEDRTYDLCLLAVSNSGHNLKYVPEEHKDELMCLRAVLTNNKAREYVKEVTEAIKAATVIGDARVAKKYEQEKEVLLFRYGTKKMVNLPHARVRNLEQQRVTGFIPFNEVKKEDMTREACFIAVRNHGLNLRYVPEELRCELIMLRAVLSSTAARRLIKGSVPDSVKIATALGHTRVASSYRRDTREMEEKYGEQMKFYMETRYRELVDEGIN